MIPLPTRIDRALTRWFATSTLTHRQVAALVAPLVLSQAWVVGQAVLNPVLVAPVGTAAINAVSTVEYLNVLFASVLMALAVAGSVLVAQHSGAASTRAVSDPASGAGGHGHGDGVRQATVGTVWTAALTGLVIGALLMVGHGPVLDVLLGPLGPDAVAMGRTYLLASAVSYPAFGVVEGAAAVLRGVARTRAALELTLVMHGGYLAIAVVLVGWGQLGVIGLAWAIVTSRWVALLHALWLLNRHGLTGPGLHGWRPRAALLTRIAVLGIPFVVEQVFFNGGKVLVQWFVVGMGPGHVTVNAIMASLAMFTEIVAFAMTMALVPLVGHAVGAGRFDEARRITRSFVVTSTAVMVLTSLALLAAFGPVMDLYRTPDDLRGDLWVILVAATVARGLGWWSIAFLVPAALRAAGDATFTTVASSISMLARVLAIWVFGVLLHGGVVAVWLVMMAEWGVRAAVFGWRFRGHTWERKRWVASAG